MKTTTAILIVVLLGASIFFLGKCSTKADRQQGIENLIAARDSVKTFSLVISGLRNTVVEKNAMILSQKEAIKAGVVDRDRLKALHLKDLVTNADLTATIRILRDSLDLPPDVVFVTVKDTSGSHLAIVLPYEWKFQDEYLSLTTGIRINKKAYFDIGVPISGTMSIGHVKSGLFKTVPKGVFTTENPYLKVNSMDILIVEEPKTLFQKTWFHIFVGSAATVGVLQLLK
jgi:hypothetical protein